MEKERTENDDIVIIVDDIETERNKNTQLMKILSSKDAKMRTKKLFEKVMSREKENKLSKKCDILDFQNTEVNDSSDFSCGPSLRSDKIHAKRKHRTNNNGPGKNQKGRKTDPEFVSSTSIVLKGDKISAKDCISVVQKNQFPDFRDVKCRLCHKELGDISMKDHMISCMKRNFEHKSCGSIDNVEDGLLLLAEKEESKNKQNEEYKKQLQKAHSFILSCPVCHQKFQSVARRTMHLKKCALSNKMTVEQMKNLVRQQEEEYKDQLHADIVPTDFKESVVKGITGKLKGKKRNCDQDENLQLAIALSKSLNEGRERTHFPAARILPRKGGSASLLLNLPKDQAEERISKRVTELLFNSQSPPEKPNSSTPAFRSDKNHTDSLKAKHLWDRTSLSSHEEENGQQPTTISSPSFSSSSALPAPPPPPHQSQYKISSHIRSAYYVSILQPPITIDNTEVGSKLRRIHSIPGRRRTIYEQATPTLEKSLTSNRVSNELNESSVEGDPTPSMRYVSQTVVDLMELVAENEGDELSQFSNDSSSFAMSPPVQDICGRKIDASIEIPPHQLKIDCSELENLSTSYLSLVNCPKLSDVQIIPKCGKPIPAHKIVLFARCAKLLERTNDNIIDLTQYSEESVLCVLKFIYGGQVSCTPNLAEDIISLSTSLCLTPLLKQALETQNETSCNKDENCHGDRCMEAAEELSSCSVPAEKETVLLGDRDKDETSSKPHMEDEDQFENLYQQKEHTNESMGDTGQRMNSLNQHIEYTDHNGRNMDMDSHVTDQSEQVKYEDQNVGSIDHSIMKNHLELCASEEIDQHIDTRKHGLLRPESSGPIESVNDHMFSCTTHQMNVVKESKVCPSNNGDVDVQTNKSSNLAEATDFQNRCERPVAVSNSTRTVDGGDIEKVEAITIEGDEYAFDVNTKDVCPIPTPYKNTAVEIDGNGSSISIVKYDGRDDQIDENPNNILCSSSSFDGVIHHPLPIIADSVFSVESSLKEQRSKNGHILTTNVNGERAERDKTAPLPGGSQVIQPSCNQPLLYTENEPEQTPLLVPDKLLSDSDISRPGEFETGMSQTVSEIVSNCPPPIIPPSIVKRPIKSKFSPRKVSSREFKLLVKKAVVEDLTEEEAQRIKVKIEQDKYCMNSHESVFIPSVLDDSVPLIPEELSITREFIAPKKFKSRCRKSSNALQIDGLKSGKSPVKPKRSKVSVPTKLNKDKMESAVVPVTDTPNPSSSSHCSSRLQLPFQSSVDQSTAPLQLGGHVASSMKSNECLQEQMNDPSDDKLSMSCISDSLFSSEDDLFGDVETSKDVNIDTGLACASRHSGSSSTQAINLLAQPNRPSLIMDGTQNDSVDCKTESITEGTQADSQEMQMKIINAITEEFQLAQSILNVSSNHNRESEGEMCPIGQISEDLSIKSASSSTLTAYAESTLASNPSHKKQHSLQELTIAINGKKDGEMCPIGQMSENLSMTASSSTLTAYAESTPVSNSSYKKQHSLQEQAIANLTPIKTISTTASTCIGPSNQRRTQHGATQLKSKEFLSGKELSQPPAVKLITPKKQNMNKRKKSWKEPSPFTPMAPYDDMNTPELKKAANKIGVRPLGKKRMRVLLKDIYAKTHQYETDSDYEPTPIKQRCVDPLPLPPQALLGLSKAAGYASENVPCHNNIVSSDDKEEEELLNSSQESLSDIQDLAEESILQGWPEEEEIYPSQLLTQTSSELLEKKLTEFLFHSSDLYEKILIYEPLELDVLKKRITDAGIRIGLAKLMDYLDEQCITFSMKNMSNQNGRHQQKGKMRTGKSSQQQANGKGHTTKSHKSKA